MLGSHKQPPADGVILDTANISHFSLLTELTEPFSSFEVMHQKILLRVKNEFLRVLVKVNARDSVFEIESREGSHSAETIRVVNQDIMRSILVDAENKQPIVSVACT